MMECQPKEAKMHVPLTDLARAHDSLRDRMRQALDDVVSSSAFVGGRFLRDFEERFAYYCGSRYAVGVSSGTSALRLALLACGVKAGDEVITVPNTYIATVEAICQTGARPVFVDIESETGNMDMSLVKGAVTERTKAVIPVHLYGLPCDMTALSRVVTDGAIMVIEDACQAHGAEYKIDGAWFRTGSRSLAGCFSFYPTKNLGALGEGGMVVTESDEVAMKLRMLRDHGQKDKNIHMIEGSNERLHSIQAAFLSAKLRLLDKWNDERCKSAQAYAGLLKDLPIRLPQPVGYARPVYHLYVIQVEKRDALKSFLSSKSIDTAIHYPTPAHLQPAYSHLGYKRGDFPVAEKWSDDILSLPMFVGLRRDEIEYVADAMREFYKGAPRAKSLGA